MLKLKSVSGSQKFSVLGKVIKCALSFSHGNVDNERSLSINKNTLSKERSSLSIAALNRLRAVEDGVRNEGGLSNIAVNKGCCISEEFSKQQESEAKRRKEEDLKKINGLRKSIKEVDERESKAEEMLQSACAFLEEGDERMA